jgi:hypothetical protein
MQAPVQTEWSVPAAQERCRILRQSLEARGVPAARLDTGWPGTAEGRDPAQLDSWIQCYVQLRVEWAQLETQREQDKAALGGAVAESLANTPHPVTLSVGVKQVHPKSYHALRFLDTLDWSLRDVAQRAARLAAVDGGPESTALEALALKPLVESHAVRLWAWVLTAEGTGLPFPEDAPGEPPSWTKHLVPEDLLALAQAHYQVHARRLQILSDAFPSDTSNETRLPLAGFLGTQAAELGVRPMELLRSWSLGEAFASAITAAQAAREAHAAAKAKAAA